MSSREISRAIFSTFLLEKHNKYCVFLNMKDLLNWIDLSLNFSPGE